MAARETDRWMSRYLARRAAAAAEVRERNRFGGHYVTAERDYAHAFRSSPGSPDWKARCACGWSSSAWHYGETEAMASALRHMRGASS